MKVLLLFFFICFGISNCQKPKDLEADNDVKPKIPSLISDPFNAELQDETPAPDEETEESSTEKPETVKPEDEEPSTETPETTTEIPDEPEESEPSSEKPSTEENEPNEEPEQPERETIEPQPPYPQPPNPYGRQPGMPSTNELFHIRISTHALPAMPGFFPQPRPRPDQSQPSDNMLPTRNNRRRFWSLFDKNSGDSGNYRGESNRILLVTVRDPLEKYSRAQRYQQYMFDKILELVNRLEMVMENELNSVKEETEKKRMTIVLKSCKQFTDVLHENSLFNITQIMAPHVNNPLNTLLGPSSRQPSQYNPASEPYVPTNQGNNIPTGYNPASQPYVPPNQGNNIPSGYNPPSEPYTAGNPGYSMPMHHEAQPSEAYTGDNQESPIPAHYAQPYAPGYNQYQ